MSEKMIGRIKWFDINKGYGYITGYDEENYYFELDNLITNPTNLESGVEVKFMPNMLTKIPYADEIELYENKNNPNSQ